MEKKNLEDNVLEEVTGGTEIIIGEDGRVKDNLKPTDISLHVADVIEDIIKPAIPTVLKQQ